MNDLYVTKRTKFHWKDLKHVINFVDNVTEIAQRMNTGFWMRLIRPMVHILNKTNCVHKMLVKSLILVLMLINYIYIYIFNDMLQLVFILHVNRNYSL